LQAVRRGGVKDQPSGARAGRRARRRHTEDDLAALLPHLGDERLARVDDASEADLDVLERAKRLEDVLGRDTHEAEPVED
jgi:hypothetical protein